MSNKLITISIQMIYKICKAPLKMPFLLLVLFNMSTPIQIMVISKRRGYISKTYKPESEGRVKIKAVTEKDFLLIVAKRVYKSVYKRGNMKRNKLLASGNKKKSITNKIYKNKIVCSFLS